MHKNKMLNKRLIIFGIFFSLLISIGVVFNNGFEVRWSEYFTTKALTYFSNVDYEAAINQDVMSTLIIPNTASVVLWLFKNVYDIPFYQFIVSIAFIFSLALSFFWLSWIITKNIFISTLSVCFLLYHTVVGFTVSFGTLSIFKKLSLFPLGYSSIEFLDPLFISFRTASHILMVLILIAFIKQRYLIVGILTGLSFYIHPFNSLNIFISISLVNIIILFLNKDKRQSIYNILKVSIPFLVLIMPYSYNAITIFKDISLIPFAEFWNFIIKNEVDDISIVYQLKEGWFTFSFLYSVIASVLYVFLISKKPITFANIRNVCLIDNKITILLLLLVPWILVTFSIFYEGSGLFHYMPDRLNDILIVNLEARRSVSVAAFIYVPILSLLFTKIFFSFLFFIKANLKNLFNIPSFIKRFENSLKKWRISVDDLIYLILTVGLMLLVVSGIGKALLKENRWDAVEKYLNFEHKPFEYFANQYSPMYGTEEYVKAWPDEFPEGFKPFYTSKACVDVFRWIRNNTPQNAAFFAPTYLKKMRTYSERQSFLAEKYEGSWACKNRAFATIYLKRFSDIHRGLTYSDLPGTVSEGGEAYFIMRERFLSLNKDDIENLRKKYPHYTYLLTEVGHDLPYSVLYRDDYFIIYRLK